MISLLTSVVSPKRNYNPSVDRTALPCWGTNQSKSNQSSFEHEIVPKTGLRFLTLLEPQSRSGDKPVKFQVVCPQNGTAVLKREHGTSVAVLLFFSLPLNKLSHLLIVSVGTAHDYTQLIPSVVNKTSTSREL